MIAWRICSFDIRAPLSAAKTPVPSDSNKTKDALSTPATIYLNGEYWHALAWDAELAAGRVIERVYVVEPTGRSMTIPI